MGLLDKKKEDQIASEIMQEAGFETAEVPETPEPPEVQVQAQAEAVEEALEEVSILGVGKYDECYEEEEPEDPEFVAAEQRMLKATLYRQLIKGRFFDGDGALVLQVEAEVKDFVKKQYLLLSGATVAPVEKDFSPEEVVALKSLAERIVKSPKLLAEPKTPCGNENCKGLAKSGKTYCGGDSCPNWLPKAPTVTPKPLPKVAAPVTPPVKKPPVEPAKAPQLKPRQVPVDVPQQPKPAKPKAKAPEAAPAPVAKTVLATVPADESVVEEGGQKYKIKYIEMTDIDEFGIMDGKKIRTLKSGQATWLSNNIQVVKNGGSVHKILRTIVNNVQQTPGRLPFPSITQMGAISLMHATEAQAHLKPTFDKILGRG